MNFYEAQREARVGDRMALWPERAQWLYDCAVSVLHLDGEYWECGSWRGGSAKLLSCVLRERPRPLRLFDTFTGFANVDNSVDGPVSANGDMFYSHDAVNDIRAFINESFCTLHPGAIPAGFTGFEDSKIALAYLDVDLYQPTVEAMKFILPRMVPGGMIVIDDCGDPNWPGVEKAVRENMGNNVLTLHGSQDPYHNEYIGWQGRIQL